VLWSSLRKKTIVQIGITMQSTAFGDETMKQSRTCFHSAGTFTLHSTTCTTSSRLKSCAGNQRSLVLAFMNSVTSS
jgi:hypothetical protein